MTRRVLVLSAGLGTPSSTRLLADRLAEAAAAAIAARGEEPAVEVVELRGLAHQVTDHLLTGFAPPELSEVLERVRRADGLVAVTPVFSASYSGLFKSFVDVIEPGALDGTPVLVAATAGTARHSLVLDHALRPLFAYLRAVVVPTGVFAATDDFGSADGGGVASDLDKRIARAAAELASAITGTAGTPRVERPRTFDEELAEPTPFEQLLREASGLGLDTPVAASQARSRGSLDHHQRVR